MVSNCAADDMNTFLAQRTEDKCAKSATRWPVCPLGQFRRQPPTERTHLMRLCRVWQTYESQLRYGWAGPAYRKVADW